LNGLLVDDFILLSTVQILNGQHTFVICANHSLKPNNKSACKNESPVCS